MQLSRSVHVIVTIFLWNCHVLFRYLSGICHVTSRSFQVTITFLSSDCHAVDTVYDPHVFVM